MEKENVVKPVIAFTKVDLPWGWLGNMAPYPVKFEGKLWKTTEALFQAMRFNDDIIKEEIRSKGSPMSAKMVAKKNRQFYCIEPRAEIDVENMIICLKLKLEQHPELITKLKNSRDYLIIEDVTARKASTNALFWGAAKDEKGVWNGENKLGKLWMELRNQY
jgi:predicted NAD-dependent protein-ADP-ribosyltransferase YbiA (DUF1768 family)